MTRLYIFADEAGDFTFTRHQRASQYFVICTVTMEACRLGDDLTQMRRDLCWQKFDLGDYFHASEDKQLVRDQVFSLISASDKLKIQATIMEKSKAQPQVRSSDDRFFKYGWLYHFRYGLQRRLINYNEILITAASIGTKRRRLLFKEAVNDVVQQTVTRSWATAHCPSATDPCLQIADYCTWAIQRKWERKDARSYNLIKGKISYEYDLWAGGRRDYY